MGTDVDQAREVANFRTDNCGGLSVAACDGLVRDAINYRLLRMASLSAVAAATPTLVGEARKLVVPKENSLTVVSDSDNRPPASSAASRAALRESLATAAGVPRDIASNPASVWGTSLDDLKQSFSMDGATVRVKPASASSSGNAQIFTVENSATGIKEVQFSPASDVSTHSGQYYKITFTDGSKVKIIDPVNYQPSFQPNGSVQYDNNTIYLNPIGQEVFFNVKTNTWIPKK